MSFALANTKFDIVGRYYCYDTKQWDRMGALEMLLDGELQPLLRRQGRLLPVLISGAEVAGAQLANAADLRKLADGNALKYAVAAVVFAAAVDLSGLLIAAIVAMVAIDTIKEFHLILQLMRRFLTLGMNSNLGLGPPNWNLHPLDMPDKIALAAVNELVNALEDELYSMRKD